MVNNLIKRLTLVGALALGVTGCERVYPTVEYSPVKTVEATVTRKWHLDAKDNTSDGAYLGGSIGAPSGYQVEGTLVGAAIGSTMSEEEENIVIFKTPQNKQLRWNNRTAFNRFKTRDLVKVCYQDCFRAEYQGTNLVRRIPTGTLILSAQPITNKNYNAGAQ